MPFITTDDNVRLYYEEAGQGEALIFVHEFAGDHRAWELQMRHFAKRYRCITYSARGYPPSDVPADGAYSQDRARLDILSIMDGLSIDSAHVCGLSMGGFATLHFGLHHPDRARSLVVAGCGYGAEPDKRSDFQAEAEATAKLIETLSPNDFAEKYGSGPTRVQFMNKDPRGWAEFRAQLAEHSMEGAARTMRGVQKSRPSLFDLEDQLKNLTVPTLIMTGDEDEPCLIPNVFLKRTISTSALVVLPNAGHTINLEDPELFNRSVDDFLYQVRSGRWSGRDPRSISASILSTDGN